MDSDEIERLAKEIYKIRWPHRAYKLDTISPNSKWYWYEIARHVRRLVLEARIDGYHVAVTPAMHPIDRLNERDKWQAELDKLWEDSGWGS